MTDALKDKPTDDIARALVDLEAEIALLGAERKVLMAEMQTRMDVDIRAALKKADKTHGKVTIKKTGFEVEADTRQEVEWDSAKLMAASSDAETMTPEEAQHLFKVDLSVPEKIYNALPPGKIKDALTAARTTKLKSPSIKVKLT